MWWSVAGNKQPDSAAAQLYHFDMDRIRWIKFFINLTDVTAENGPHCFIAGSQQTCGIPRHLLAKGYTRLSDEPVRRESSRTHLLSSPRRRERFSWKIHAACTKESRLSRGIV